MAGNTIAPTKLLPSNSLSQQSPGAIATTTTSSRAARHHGADWPGGVEDEHGVDSAIQSNGCKREGRHQYAEGGDVRVLGC